jgi:hypothetical protein
MKALRMGFLRRMSVVMFTAPAAIALLLVLAQQSAGAHAHA